MSVTESKPQQDEQADSADSKFNPETQQTTIPKKVVEVLGLTDDRIYYRIFKSGKVVMERWSPPSEATPEQKTVEKKTKP